MPVTISPISESDVPSFRLCLQAVAQERRFLALFEAPALDDMRTFVAENIRNKVPQVIALDGERVVGWCDISPGWHHALKHCGSLGMGLLPEYRRQGLGTKLLQSCIAQARAVSITRVELEARVDNIDALKLYEKLGFIYEGTKKRGMRVDGEYINTLAMALLIQPED
jgi:RimJ/RimL family protein N-acetyltransferase